MLNLSCEAGRCLLCYEAACTACCPKGFDPAGMVRAVRFNDDKRGSQLVDNKACEKCDAPCEKACIHYDMPIRIREMARALPEKAKAPDKELLKTEFMGVKCENPFFLSSSVIAGNYEMCAKALKMGWGGIVYKTIGFLIPDEVSPRFDAVTKEGTPFIGFKNLEQISDHPLNENLTALKRLKEDFPTKVIVASIMGQNEEEWEELARLCEEAGVDIIECNFSCPQMCGDGLGSDVGVNPELVAKYTAAVRRGTKLPVLAKMTPNLANMEPPAIAAINAGADGLAAINTIKSITAVDLDSIVPLPVVAGKSAIGGYSGKAVKPVALRFIHDLAVCDELKDAPISGMGGIETWQDALEFILLGCGNVQVTTSVMQYGYRIIDDLIYGLSSFMEEKGFSSIEDMRGRALPYMVSADDLDRKTLQYPKFDREKCIGCKRCYVSCEDAGHQAIGIREGKPTLIANNCVGCHLCRLVCPISAIGVLNRVNKP